MKLDKNTKAAHPFLAGYGLTKKLNPGKVAISCNRWNMPRPQKAEKPIFAEPIAEVSSIFITLHTLSLTNLSFNSLQCASPLLLTAFIDFFGVTY